MNVVLWCMMLSMLLHSSQAAMTASKPAVAQLKEGHYQLTVLVEDSTLGRGVAGIDVIMKMRRGFFMLGSKKTYLELSTGKDGRATIQGLPKGKVELLIYTSSDTIERFEPDLQPGPKNRVQIQSRKLKITIEWILT
jgi:hypothetical protein